MGGLAFEEAAFVGCVGLEPARWCRRSRAHASRLGGLQKLLGCERISESSPRVNEMVQGDWVGQEAGHRQRLRGRSTRLGGKTENGKTPGERIGMEARK